MDLAMLDALLQCHKRRQKVDYKLAMHKLQEASLIRYDVKDGWVPSDLGNRLLESAGYLIERAREE